MQSKIRIKLGQIEIEYEGSEAFLKEELSDFVSSISQLYNSLPKAETVATQALVHGSPMLVASNGKNYGTTTNIASKLNSKGPSDLIVSASAHLYFTQCKETFTRSELIDAMKSAPAYLGKSDIKNLSSTLKSLLKAGRLNEVKPGVFSLTAAAISEMEARLAA